MAQSATGMKRGKPSRSARTAKSKRQPRSLGLTYAAVRRELGLSQPAMHRYLERIGSEYIFPAPVTRKTALALVSQAERRNRDRQRRGATVSRWEGPQGNPPFSVSHRYGVASRTYSGILDLTSLIYAELRDAGTSPDPTQHLECIRLLCSQMMRFAANARRLAEEYSKTRSKYNLKKLPDDGNIYFKHLDLINEILDAFRGKG